MTQHVDSSFFHAEATLPPDLPCYVERRADAELLKALRNGKFTVILSSRKVGKSSLLERAFANLRTEQVCVVKKELAEADRGITEESWYAGLIEELVNDAKRRNGFEVDATWRTWWSERANLPAGQRFTDFLRTFFLEASSQPWVIAIDEIDTTIPLPFSDDFFAAIRRCQNARAADPLFTRLTFLLAGVASPAQLIKDNRRTPFNIGHAVTVTDFTAEEAQTLLNGLSEPIAADHPALTRVLYWTGGHPYLTQCIFLKLAEELEDAPTDSDPDWELLVDQAVKDTFLRPGALVNEPHLFDIARRRIGYLDKPSNPNADPDLKRRMLSIYQRALAGKLVKDDALDRPIVELKLCGVLVPDKKAPAQLVVRNRIYRTVFDSAWVATETPRNPWKRAAIAAVLIASLGVSSLGLWQRQSRIADLVEQIDNAVTDVPTIAVTELSSYYGQQEHPQVLLARYWTRQARSTSVQRPRDEAAVDSLKALSIHETPEIRLQARRALSGSLRYILATFRHNGPVNSVVFSTDGRRVVTASTDGTARVWDAETGQPFGSPLKHNGTVNSAAFSADGRLVITASDDNTARVWDAQTDQPLGSPLKHNGTVNSAAFSTDGRRVITASSDGTARMWDAETGQPFGSPLKHNGPIYFAAFSTDGRRVITASFDNTARVWDAETGQPVGSPLKHEGPINSAAFSADGRRVVTASDDNTARAWDAETGKPLGNNPLEHEFAVNSAAFSADGRRVVTASRDDTARVWDAETGQPLGSPLKHDGTVNSAAFSADGRRVITASNDGTARVWDAETGQPLSNPLKHEFVVNSATFSTDGQRVVTASSDNTARVWDAATGQPLGSPLKHDRDVTSATFSADGQRVVTASLDNTARVWDAATGQPLGSPLKHDGYVFSAAFSADGQRVVTASRDNTARVWDAATGQPLGSPLKHDRDVTSATFSADGQRVVTASLDNTARVWDAATGQPLGSPLKHDGTVTSAAFSGDGQRVVTASWDNTARVWDAATGQPLGSPLKHDGTVTSAAFSGDGQRVVTASWDNTARVWDAATGQPLGSPLKHDRDVTSATFSADGQRVVTASRDNTARVWDAATGQPLGSPLKHDRDVTSATFSADGQRVVTATRNTMTWHIEQDPGNWQPQATVWPNSKSWSSSPLLMNPKENPSGEKIRIADSWTRNILLIRDFSLQKPEKGLPKLEGTGEELLTRYLQRFALKFEDDQRSPSLQPTFPAGSRGDADLKQPGEDLPIINSNRAPDLP